MLRQILGQSPAVAAIREQVNQLLTRTQAAPKRLPPVLIEGETGTGKGLVASAIHAGGPRASSSFIDVNCAAIPETLLEAELFGFERGAFTDARQAKAGLLQVAHRGTIFMDEIGLMPDALQVKLLKALEDRTVRRLGSTRAEPADAWVIAATSEDLPSAISGRRFREDLYHRLAVMTLRMPPLRERGDDVLLLAHHYLDRACREYGLPPKTLAPDARDALVAYSWPGNVRELANVMERVALLSDVEQVTAASLHLPRVARTSAPASRSAERIDDQMASLERGRIEEALRAEGGNISRAAARLGLPRNTLRYRMVRHGLVEGGEAASARTAAPAVADGPASTTAAPVRWTRTRITFLQAQLATVGEDATDRQSFEALERIAAKVSGFGGRILDLDASSVRGAFGLEIVEDAPRHAAHVALAAQRMMAALSTAGLPPPLRIALHTDEMLVGRVDDRAELHVDGRRAAQEVLDRMLAGASGDVILASAETRHFLARRFDLESVDGSAEGPWRVRGFSETARATTPLVSRNHELGLLEQLLEQVENGHGQAVLIAGDPGIGKSRLLEEFQRRSRDRAAWMQGAAVAFGAALPLHPVVDLLRRACAVQPGESDDVIRRRIDSVTGAFGAEFQASVPFLQALVATAAADSSHVPLDPKLRRAATFEAVARFLHASSHARPLVVAIEDVHWMDPATSELLSLLLEGVAASRMLLCVTHRTGYTLPFPSSTFNTQLTLASVSRSDSVALACAVLGVPALAPELRQLVDERTDGNPFFVEEMLRSLDEQGLLDRRAADVGLRGPITRITVPGRVQDVLIGRIERLDAASRDLLRVAAVIGREFPRRVLERFVTGTPPLDERLRALRAAELIYHARVWPEVVYVFKHALTQEVAYEAQTDAERQALHARIGDAIEALDSGGPPERAGILAHHFVQAQRWDKALTYLLTAAQHAERTYAAREALALYGQALLAAGQLAGGGDPQTLIAIHDARARLYFVTSDFDRAVAEGERILPLARLTNNRVKEAEALAMIGWASMWARRLDAAIRFSREALAIAGPAGAVSAQGRAHYTIGFTRAVTGALDEGQEELRRAVQISTSSRDATYRSLSLASAGLLRNWAGDFPEAARLQREASELAAEQGLLFPLLFSCFVRGLTLTGKGDYDEALAVVIEGLSLAERVGDEAVHHRLLNGLGWLFADLGDLDHAEALNAQSARIGRRRGDPGTQPNAELNLAEIFHARGDLAHAQDQYDAVYRYWNNPPSQWMRFRYSMRMFAGMGELALTRGDLAAARSHSAESLDLATRTGSRKNLVKALRLAAEIAAAAGEHDAAEGQFRKACDLAAALGNPAQHWKSELAFGRFLQSAGRSDDAARAFQRARAVMHQLQGRLHDDRLRRAFEKNPDWRYVQSLAANS